MSSNERLVRPGLGGPVEALVDHRAAPVPHRPAQGGEVLRVRGVQLALGRVAVGLVRLLVLDDRVHVLRVVGGRRGRVVARLDHEVGGAGRPALPDRDLDARPLRAGGVDVVRVGDRDRVLEVVDSLRVVQEDPGDFLALGELLDRTLRHAREHDGSGFVEPDLDRAELRRRSRRRRVPAGRRSRCVAQLRAACAAPWTRAPARASRRGRSRRRRSPRRRRRGSRPAAPTGAAAAVPRGASRASRPASSRAA